MKHFTTFALVATFAGIGIAACSSDPSVPSTGGGGSTTTGGNINKAGSTSLAGTTSLAGSTNTAGVSTGGVSTGGVSTGGTSTSGSTTGGTTTAGTGTGGAGGGSAGSGGSGGGNPNAVEATCGIQMYTKNDAPTGCASKSVPATPLIAAFEDAGASPGWGVYPNVDGKTGFTPTNATPSAGGANGTAKALAFSVVNVDQGIKIEVGFGTTCQDVRTFKGLSFWAKGTIDAATQPFAVDKDTIVIQIGSETSLLGGCVGQTCSAAPPDKRQVISAEWKEYRIPFDCFGNGMVFDGYYTKILFSAFGTNSSFAIDQVGYYN